ncbi:mitochondrial ribosomal protein S26 [Cotesia typhae]|uniref:mitochondrial ribosomal protein S26 n=1 Tax=Cotesia typhae TaxID=2053667 RepID=UPI003D68014A
MLRTSGTINKMMNNLIINEWVGINAINSQTIRWRKRKPMWLPPAKSKLFRILPRYRLPPEEAIEIRRLSNNYNTQMKSLRGYFMKVVEENKEQLDEELNRKTEEKDFKRCMEINDQWNKVQAQNREERLRREDAERKREILKKLDAKKARDEGIMNEVETRVKKLKEEVKNFITEENIDQAIEEAMANPINYNYAIDSLGNKYDKSIVEEQIKQSAQQ